MKLNVLALMVLVFGIHVGRAQVQNDRGTVTLKNGEKIGGLIRYSYDEAGKVIVEAEQTMLRTLCWKMDEGWSPKFMIRHQGKL